MRVAIIGGGAVGMLLASYVHLKHEVTIYTRTERQADLLNRQGICCKVDDEYFQRPVKAVKFFEANITADIYIVAVKQYSLAEMLPLLQQLQGKLILFVQNGMGHVRERDKFQLENICVGVVEHGASKLNDRSVMHAGKGSISIGAAKGSSAMVKGVFIEKNFPITYDVDWETIAIRKLIVNAVINPLTALYKVENGILISNSYFFEMMKKVFGEVYSVVGREGKTEMWENLLKICRGTEKNKSSMLRDIENERRTEVDYIVGYVLDMAKEKKIAVPFLTFLFISIKGFEETFAFNPNVQ